WADAERYGGAHLAAIDAAFAHRGIPNGSPQAIALSVPAFTWTDSTYTFRARPDCGFGPFDYAWATSPDSGATWRPLGVTTDAVAVGPVARFTPRVGVRDRHGAESIAATPIKVYNSADTTLHFRGVHIQGPTLIGPHEVNAFRFVLDGGAGVPPSSILW